MRFPKCNDDIYLYYCHYDWALPDSIIKNEKTIKAMFFQQFFAISL